MTFIWLVVWLIFSRNVPHAVDAWVVTLAVCAFLDLLATARRS